MEKDIPSNLTPEQTAELNHLAALPDDRIDTTQMPEQRDWHNAKRGVFFRPIKQQLTLRPDADVVAWFKSHAPKTGGYQTRMNTALRDYVARNEGE